MKVYKFTSYIEKNTLFFDLVVNKILKKSIC